MKKETFLNENLECRPQVMSVKMCKIYLKGVAFVKMIGFGEECYFKWKISRSAGLWPLGVLSPVDSDTNLKCPKDKLGLDRTPLQ